MNNNHVFSSSTMRTIVWAVIAGLLIWTWYNAGNGSSTKTISYTEFKQNISSNKIKTVVMHGKRVTGTYRKANSKQNTGQTASSHHFTTTLPPVNDPSLLPLLSKHGVNITAKTEQTAWWLRLIINLLPWVLIIGLIWFTSNRMRQKMNGENGPGGMFGFGKSKAKRHLVGESKVTFDDIAGQEHAKRDLQEITGYLREPVHYRKLGAKIPKGILLMGQPGVGKTLMAKAVAGEAGVPFYSISGSEFIEMFVGVGASRVRDMFESAKKESPSIIFIDEIDSVGRARGAGLGGGNDEREQTLNQFLGEMDGFSPNESVVVLAATNRPDVLDPALLRPGRFDRKVTLDLPDRKARKDIMKLHTRNVPISDDVDLDRIAALTVGFSGADLENLINEAALLVGRDHREQVDLQTLLTARDKLVLGGPREMLISDEEKRLISYHEAGHTIVASKLAHADPLDKVTIIPRGRALGATEQIPEEERHNFQQSYLLDRIGVMLGGRVSEQLVYGEVSSGAEGDLKQATNLARHMIANWGMSENLGPVSFQLNEEHIFLGREISQARSFSEHTAELIDNEVMRLVREVESNIQELVKDNFPQLKALAEALVEHETLEISEIETIIKQAA